MTSSGQRRWGSTALRVVFPLAIVCSLSPMAQASCGDYVIIGHGASATPTAHLTTTQPHTPAPAPQPCRGPHCSRLPVAPAPATPLPTVERGEDWGVLTLSDALFPLDRGTAVGHAL